MISVQNARTAILFLLLVGDQGKSGTEQELSYTNQAYCQSRQLISTHHSVLVRALAIEANKGSIADLTTLSRATCGWDNFLNKTDMSVNCCVHL